MLRLLRLRYGLLCRFPSSLRTSHLCPPRTRATAGRHRAVAAQAAVTPEVMPRMVPRRRLDARVHRRASAGRWVGSGAIDEPAAVAVPAHGRGAVVAQVEVPGWPLRPPSALGSLWALFPEVAC
jgi:hypothetical protein